MRTRNEGKELSLKTNLKKKTRHVLIREWLGGKVLLQKKDGNQVIMRRVRGTREDVPSQKGKGNVELQRDCQKATREPNPLKGKAGR